MSAHIEEIVKPIKAAPRVLGAVHQSVLNNANLSHAHLLKLIVIEIPSVELVGLILVETTSSRGSSGGRDQKDCTGLFKNPSKGVHHAFYIIDCV